MQVLINGYPIAGSSSVSGFGRYCKSDSRLTCQHSLSVVNADIGPNDNITWVTLIHTVGLSVALTIVGRLGDIFGRRWLFIGGACTAAAGTLV
jgi:MFS family permease